MQETPEQQYTRPELFMFAAREILILLATLGLGVLIGHKFWPLFVAIWPVILVCALIAAALIARSRP